MPPLWTTVQRKKSRSIPGYSFTLPFVHNYQVQQHVPIVPEHVTEIFYWRLLIDGINFWDIWTRWSTFTYKSNRFFKLIYWKKAFYLECKNGNCWNYNKIILFLFHRNSMHCMCIGKIWRTLMIWKRLWWNHLVFFLPKHSW